MSGCEDFLRICRLQRRDLLIAGTLGTLSSPLGSAAARDPLFPARARSILMLYLFGGPGQLDTFDMKPNAPEEIRGEFKPIATSVPGLHICEHLPRTARIMDKLTLVRTLSHNRTVHGGAVVYALTGQLNRDPGIPGVRGPDASLADFPNVGSAIRRLGPREIDMPNAIVLPWRMIDGQGREPPGQWAGMLGKLYDPWLVESDPNRPGFRVDALSLPAGLSLARMQQRQGLLELVDRQVRHFERITDVAQLDALQDQAARLLTTAKVRKAFAIDEEPASLRDRYGRNTFGQACLLARRLVEAGTPFVQVNMGPRLFGDYGWDTHSKTFPTMKNLLCPKFDSAYATLLEDLDARGLLRTTLMLVNTEFGRTPLVNKRDGGRDHWPDCYCLLFAGAGIARGKVIGRSDSRAAYPVSQPYSPADVAATLYSAMGIDPASEIRDHLGQPKRLSSGRVIEELYS